MSAKSLDEEMTAMEPMKGPPAPPAGEEATNVGQQGPSYLVERITPVPPQRETMILPPKPSNPPQPAPSFQLPPGIPADPARDASPEERTMTVVNPPPVSGGPPKALGPVQVKAPALQPGGITMMTKEAPPTMDTAFVPVPGLGQAPAPAAPGLLPGSTDVAPAVKGKGGGLSALVERVKGDQKLRLLLIGGCGVLGILLTLVLFNPRRGPVAPPTDGEQRPVQVGDVPGAGTAAQKNADPGAGGQPPPGTVSQDEKDALLEKAVLAVEAGRTDEALALFRRYLDEGQDEAASFMVQLLQLQATGAGKEQ